ncbi:uncharacterized protein LOC109545444 [Dendroctonus ponderosae]|uniref:uncharacterized protein LOC109545444 n=1 Tax=Dendroctonus ponderosae TaxID=77166 RepID=UPI0020354632|nr:uncharacterized protein LOC109545444 [Dendroctonus ponderosae]KAH1017752.1 hypothetical protein HUJ05_008349 [Dendroctonus ponderosae]
MIRYRIFCLLLLSVQLSDVLSDAQGAEKTIANSPVKKSQPADNLGHSSTGWLYSTNNVQDLSASASEFKEARYPPPNFHLRGQGRSCYDCNSEPWIPIVGRSLYFPTPASSHSNSLEFSNKPYFKEKGQFNLLRPPIDQYGAPQAKFNYPATGEVVDFMLPPPYIPAAVSNAYLPAQQFNAQSSPAPSVFNLRPPPTWSGYTAPPRRPSPPKYLPPYPTTPLRPVSQNFQPPPLIGIHNLPLEKNHNLPPAMPSDSYGRPITAGHSEPITASSEYTRVNPVGHFASFQQSFVRTHPSDFSNVQVVPSVQIADYTASIEHPINLIQSPIFDLNVDDQSKESSSREKLSENPIVVDDSFSSSSDLNTTYSSELAHKRHNDKYLASGEFGNPSQKGPVDLRDNLIQKLLFEQNIIDDPNSVGSKQTQAPGKNLQNLQIVVPYVRSGHPTAIYNREYTTLAPVFVPPPISSEATTLWSQLVEDIQTISHHQEPAQGFATSTSTEVYNIKDFIAKNNFPSYDLRSLQKNIDHWTHQAYSNRHSPIGQFSTQLKQIPQEYLSSTAKDHEAANSDRKEVVIEDIETNSIIPQESSEEPNKPQQLAVRVEKPPWESNKVTLSNSTHEKVYVVTPQSYHIFPTSTPTTGFSMAPKVENGQVNNASTMTRISVRIEKSDEGDEKKAKPLKVVYSEWPHLINDLETTTTSKPTTRHPLFGLMDLAPYTVSSNSMVETIGGHSKVTSVGTSPLFKFTSTTPTPFKHANDTVKVSAE